MKRMPGISLLVHTRNSARSLPRLLAATRWVDELIVIDMESSDATCKLASEAGARVISIVAEPFRDESRNLFLSEPSFAWTLVLDSDEYLSDHAESILRKLTEDADDATVGFALPRSNAIAGRVLRGTAHFPDHQMRLFRTDSVRYQRTHHRPPQPLDPSARIVACDPAHTPWIHHMNETTLEDFIVKQLRYAATDDYELADDTFSFDDAVAAGIEQFHARYEPEIDGSLSYALALTMYWDQIIRGLIRWERLGMIHPLPEHAPMPPPHPQQMPIASEQERTHDVEAELRETIASLAEQLEAIQRSRSMTMTAPLRRLAGLLRPRR